MTVRVALIGAGVMGADHARVIAEEVPGAELRIIADVAEATARELADRYGASDVLTDALKAVTHPDVDAILVASPDATHKELCLEALAHGRPVLCEKPLAEDEGDCIGIMEAENKLGRQLIQVGFMRRFDPAYIELKSTVDNGTVGDVLMMHNFHRNVAEPPHFGGTMAITNSAPHEFDIIRFVLDEEITTITAQEPLKACNGQCKPIVMLMQTASGRLVSAENNINAAYGYDIRAEVVGTEGSVSLANPVLTQLNTQLNAKAGYAADWRPRFADAYRLQNQSWINAINNDEPNTSASNAWDGYCATAVAMAGARSLVSGRATPIQLVERPAIYC